MKSTPLVATLTISLVVNFLLASKVIHMTSNSKFHILKEPMIFESESAEDKSYLIPSGTTLYFDKAFPEGHVRYIIYINYKGKALELQESDKPGFIAPSWIHQIDKDELTQLMNKYPLSKDDLKRILKSNSFTRAELIEIINSYQE